MPPPTQRKKFVLFLTTGAPCSGFADPEAFAAAPLAATGATHPVLLSDGQRLELPREQLLAAYAVADFVAPERLTQPPPRGALPLPGVRVRCRTLDHQNREGLLASDLLQLSRGIELAPPCAESLWQRLYIPHHALAQMTILSVVRTTRRRTRPEDQFSLFSPQGPQ